MITGSQRLSQLSPAATTFCRQPGAPCMSSQALGETKAYDGSRPAATSARRAPPVTAPIGTTQNGHCTASLVKYAAGTCLTTYTLRAALMDWQLVVADSA